MMALLSIYRCCLRMALKGDKAVALVLVCSDLFCFVLSVAGLMVDG